MPMSKLQECFVSVLAKTLSFANDRRGVSAVEFAIIAPLMVSLYLGGVEVSDAVAASRKTTIVARTVADLVAQDSKLTNAGKDDVMNAAKLVATPYGNANLGITVSSIKIDNAGIAKVEWSDTKDGIALTVGSTVTLDAALAVPNTWLILGEATYNYIPTFGEGVTGPITMSDKIYMRPRISPNVQRTAS
jgi:Flp pilus assembly protein TadG